MSEQKATNQGAKIWPDTSPPAGFMAGYANPPEPGKVRGALGRAAPGAVEHALKQGSGRITKINEGTRAGIRKRINEAIEQGMSPAEAGRYVREWTGFDEYRAERIARTEMMFSYNAAATATYRDLGITHVVADDGDEDEECAARHGQVFTVDEAEGIEDHPNGTLDWLPVEPTLDPQELVKELDQVRPISSGAGAPMDALLGTVAPAPDPIVVGAKQALDKMKQGYDLTPDEGDLIQQALAKQGITPDDFMDAQTALMQHQNDTARAYELLGKLNHGDDLTAGEWDDLAKLNQAGIVTDDAANAAMSQQYVAKQKIAQATQYMDELAQGNDIGYLGAQYLDEVVQQGLIKQEQLNQAYAAKQLAKQKMALDDAINAMEGSYASDAQKQLVMDAISQGALSPAQQAKLQQVILKQAAMSASSPEMTNALFQVTTQYATGTEKQMVLDALQAGILTPDQKLGLTKGLVKQLDLGKPLDAQQQHMAQLLMNDGVMDANKYWAAYGKQQAQQMTATVQANLPPAPPPPPTPAAPPATAKVTKLKGPGGAGGKDKFNPATFQEKSYATREAHARALGTWQRKVNTNLSYEAKEAMRDYTNSAYHSINAVGRGNLQHMSTYELERAKKQMDLVRESMHPTTQDVVVRRGTTTHIFGPGGNTQISGDEVMRLVQPGSEWVDGGFMSTSINRGHSWSGDVLLELKVPKGTQAAWAHAISSHKSEYELLLDAGTRIVVESIERSPYGGQIKIVAHVKPR